MQRTGSSQNRPRSVPNRSEGQTCKYIEKSYKYKYDLGDKYYRVVIIVVVKLGVQSVRERERGPCLLCVAAAACGDEEDERSLPLRFLDCVFLSYSAFVYILWAVVVLPTVLGFARYILCLHIISVFIVYFVLTFSIRLWPNVPLEANLYKKQQKTIFMETNIRNSDIKSFITTLRG